MILARWWSDEPGLVSKKNRNRRRYVSCRRATHKHKYTRHPRLINEKSEAAVFETYDDESAGCIWCTVGEAEGGGDSHVNQMGSTGNEI